MAPLSGIGVGRITSYTETRSDATRIRSSPSAYTSRTLPRCSNSTLEVLAHPDAPPRRRQACVRSQPCGSVGRLISTFRVQGLGQQMFELAALDDSDPSVAPGELVGVPAEPRRGDQNPLDRALVGHRPGERPHGLRRHDPLCRWAWMTATPPNLGSSLTATASIPSSRNVWVCHLRSPRASKSCRTRVSNLASGQSEQVQPALANGVPDGLVGLGVVVRQRLNRLQVVGLRGDPGVVPAQAHPRVEAGRSGSALRTERGRTAR